MKFIANFKFTLNSVSTFIISGIITSFLALCCRSIYSKIIDLETGINFLDEAFDFFGGFLRSIGNNAFIVAIVIFFGLLIFKSIDSNKD